MADSKLDQAGRRGFAQAFASAMHNSGAPQKKGYVIAVAVAVVIFAGGAVGVGAAVSHKPRAAAKTAQAAALGTGTRLRSATPAASQKTVPSASSRPGVTVGGAAAGPNNSPVSMPFTQPGVNVAAGVPAASRSTAAAPQSAPVAPRNAAVVTSLKVSGQISCVSGNSVEGVWVQAARGSGFAPWQGLGNGSTSDWWYTLPVSEPYALHVGCGGTTATWKVATFSPTVGGAHNSFNCFDVAGASGFGTCRLR